jgi:transcription elongation GreA/GreB family factor
MPHEKPPQSSSSSVPTSLPRPLDKRALRDALARALEEACDKLARAQRATAEGVTHEDARAEGDKDMRATEASYVARGQAMRVEALVADLAKVTQLSTRALAPGEPVALSAVVLVEDDAGRRALFVAPAGGGTVLRVEGREGQGLELAVVTPSSPLGRALVGAVVGDVVSVERAQGVAELEVLDVL